MFITLSSSSTRSTSTGCKSLRRPTRFSSIRIERKSWKTEIWRRLTDAAKCRNSRWILMDSTRQVIPDCPSALLSASCLHAWLPLCPLVCPSVCLPACPFACPFCLPFCLPALRPALLPYCRPAPAAYLPFCLPACFCYIAHSMADREASFVRPPALLPVRLVVHLSVCLSVFLSVYLSVNPSLCSLCLCVCLFVCLSLMLIYLFVCLSISLCVLVCPPIFLLFVCLSVCLSVYPWEDFDVIDEASMTCPSVCLPCLVIFCLSVPLSVSLSIRMSMWILFSFYRME